MKGDLIFLRKLSSALAFVRGKFLPCMGCHGKSRKSPEIWKCYISNHGDRLVVDGAEGLCATGRAMTLVLRASWFSLSSCSRAKEIAILSVANICRKMAAKRSDKTAAMAEEEEGSSDVSYGYGATLWLQVALVAAMQGMCAAVEGIREVGTLLDHRFRLNLLDLGRQHLAGGVEAREADPKHPSLTLGMPRIISRFTMPSRLSGSLCLRTNSKSRAHHPRNGKGGLPPLVAEGPRKDQKRDKRDRGRRTRNRGGHSDLTGQEGRLEVDDLNDRDTKVREREEKD
ncbi:hypothetical protein BHE74_00018310 [Ensete ventricosum]|nr:hypothetical protein BHE74_00018310 [Ensete ventricosum]